MKQKTINIVIVLSLICVVSILAFQGGWIKNSLIISEANFDRAVNESLKQAIGKIEKRNVYKVFSRYTKTDGSLKDSGILNIIKKDSIIETKSEAKGSTLKNYIQKTEVLYFDTRDEAKAWEHRIDSIVDDILIDLSIDTLNSELNFRQGELDTNIATALVQNGVYTKFEFAIKGNDGSIITKSKEFDTAHTQHCYKILLYPFSVTHRSDELLLQIKGLSKTHIVLKAIMPVVVASIIFIVFIIITFWLTIRTILKQKKISSIKNDFINNMTHEFKTPIATINIAADALLNEGITTTQTRHFADIIKQESRSMNQKVETILQMALVEQQQVQLEKETIDVNLLVQKAIQHLQLRLEACGAQLTVNYLPNDVSVYVDVHHISNVLGNIIDNAIKYSQGTPHISISLSVTNALLAISIADEGIGMSKDEQKHVFDKFYRAQSGNIHNTKGFGLGLSYAREIVQLHKGQINIESEKGEGTTVTITLPIHNG